MGNRLIECVTSYKYLGIDFGNSGSFTLAKVNLRIKSMKASFKLKLIIGNENLLPKVVSFNSLIRPIALYGSEIWGTSLCASTLNGTFLKFDNLAERVHNV